jgi:hypothetical protein
MDNEQYRLTTFELAFARCNAKVLSMIVAQDFRFRNERRRLGCNSNKTKKATKREQ